MKKTNVQKLRKFAKTPATKAGVIDTIVELLQNGDGTVDQMAAKLAKKFPDRKAEGLTSTLKVQLTRLQKPKSEGGRGLKLKAEK